MTPPSEVRVLPSEPYFSQSNLALRQLALDRDTTLLALMIEAANDLLRKYRRKPLAETPPRS
jgi:hypothetical protein